VRGRPGGRAFTILEQATVTALTPFAIQALSFAIAPPHLDQELDRYESKLKAVLKVAEILSGVLDIEVLLPMTMEKACELLKTERCSLFLINTAHHELVTRFHGGLDTAVRIKIGRGLVGSCASSGQTVNIRDAYADQRFDSSVDLARGFVSRSLLCIPIYNNRGEMSGVP
jgi:signal transduction protein with GAF and PtsI domain